MILVATTEINTPLVFACVFLLAVTGLLLFFLILGLERRVSWFKPALGPEP